MEILIKCPECKYRYQPDGNSCPICSAPVVEDLTALRIKLEKRNKKKSRRNSIIGSLDRFINVFLGNC
ncbi:hypothetical protein KAJ27_07225 [bacterium]|nr:hypothetical protein [bacterium]